jgi:hypothetical protein
MDPRRFEAITRRVAEAGSRRGALKALAGALAAPVLVAVRGEDAAAGIPIVNCKAPGKSCDKNQKCCSGRCRRGRCGCSKKGRPCWAPLEGALCCSQKCQSGKCA